VAGNPFSGLTRVLASPYLLAVSAFVILLATVSTFLYFEQARLVAELFPERARQVQVFGLLDFVVQAGALASQVLITGRLAQRLGVRVLLAGVPLLMCIGFLGVGAAAHLRHAGGADDRQADRRIRLHPPGPRDALRAAGRRDPVQGQELHRHRGLSRR
jgi:ATP/ADP translocase